MTVIQVPAELDNEDKKIQETELPVPEEAENNADDNDEAEGHYLKECRLLWPGTFNGFEFTAENIQSIVDNFNPDVYQPPIQIDHESSALKTIGYVVDLYIKDDVMYGMLDFMDAEAISKVEADLYRYLSVGVEVSESGLCWLEEVSVTPFPAASDEKFTARILTGDRKKVALLTKERNDLLKQLSKMKQIVRQQANSRLINSLLEEGSLSPAQVRPAADLLSGLNKAETQKLVKILRCSKQHYSGRICARVKERPTQRDKDNDMLAQMRKFLK